MKIEQNLSAVVCSLALLLLSGPIFAVHDCDFGVVRAEHVKGNFHVIYGGGGTIGVLVGDEGVFLIDAQAAEVTPDILAAIRKINDGPIRFLINTHVHGDHVGGNENMAQEGAVILAHDNVRSRLVETEKSKGTLPVITFNDKASVFLNGEEMRAMHVENAHTDGDSVIFFKDSNMVHMGDVLFNNCYPFIDTGRGGSAAGTIKAAAMVLAKIDDDTIVIAGHGAYTDKAGLARYHQVLTEVFDSVVTLKAEGQSLENVLAAKPTAKYDATWTWGFINGEAFTTAIYNSLPE
jgi:cyclase